MDRHRATTVQKKAWVGNPRPREFTDWYSLFDSDRYCRAPASAGAVATAIGMESHVDRITGIGEQAGAGRRASTRTIRRLRFSNRAKEQVSHTTSEHRHRGTLPDQRALCVRRREPCVRNGRNLDGCIRHWNREGPGTSVWSQDVHLHPAADQPNRCRRVSFRQRHGIARFDGGAAQALAAGQRRPASSGSMSICLRSARPLALSVRHHPSSFYLRPQAYRLMPIAKLRCV